MIDHMAKRKRRRGKGKEKGRGKSSCLRRASSAKRSDTDARRWRSTGRKEGKKKKRSNRDSLGPELVPEFIWPYWVKGEKEREEREKKEARLASA